MSWDSRALVAGGRHLRRYEPELGLDPRDVELMNWVGILHDVGKLAVSPEVLRKPGPLSELEWADVKRHPVVGSDLILAISSELAPLAAAIRLHHERLDKPAIPTNSTGLTFPLFGRIVALADVFDAVTHQRDYRPVELLEKRRRRVRQGQGEPPFRSRARKGVRLSLQPRTDLLWARRFGRVSVSLTAGRVCRRNLDIGIGWAERRRGYARLTRGRFHHMSTL